MKIRLIAALLGLTILTLLVHDIPLARYLRTVEYNRILTGLERDSFIIGGHAEEALESPSAQTLSELQQFINHYSKSKNARVLVTNSAAIVVSASDTKTAIGSSYLTRPEFMDALSGKVSSGSRFSYSLGYQMVYVAVPVQNGSRILGAVRMTFPKRIIDRVVTTRLEIIGVVAGLTLLLATLIAFLLAGSFTRRLNQLETVSQDFAHGNLDARADESSGAPEIKSLAKSFNSMADELGYLISQQRAFVSDASHQLRTPLTALKLRLESANNVIDSDIDGAKMRIEAAMLETDRLENLVESLLALSRVERDQKAEPERIDVSQILKDRLENWLPLAREHDIDLVLNAREGLSALALNGSLEQIIDNFIDNALEVSPEHSKIVISAGLVDSMVHIQVLDEGPGMPEQDLARAFDRFWRARSDAYGSGLGLAIVQRLVELSGGSCGLQNRETGGLAAYVYLPMA